ncbi:hypothetical protein QQ054_04855 [Oscillatoria amoena NRMC-F 0135]|nr:hypothetical protein [Oscillatoria amoena NRMC-F 0135]MDL5053465.1 hypothetical protein [Oscillatoria laete-virens NRMC-F 0139]
MRTTLNIKDDLYRQIKVKAAMENVTVTELVERGITHVIDGADLTDRVRTKPRKLPVISGGHKARPGQELTPEKIDRILLGQEF